MPLKIVIVGAGPAGLSAAGYLRKHHDVVVLERNTLNFDINDYGFSIISNAFNLLIKAGLDPERLNMVTMTHLWQRSSQNAEIFTMDFDTRKRFGGAPSILTRRANLQRELLRFATSGDFPGQPATVVENAKVTKIDITTGTIWTEDDKVYEADLIVGADGINSIVRTAVLTDGTKPTSTPAKGRTNDLLAFMTQIPVDLLSGTSNDFLARPTEAAGLVNWPSPQGPLDKSRLLAYHISSSEIQVVGYAPEREFSAQFDQQKTSILRDVDASRVQTEYKGSFSTDIVDLFTHRPIEVWRIRDAEPLDTWTRGKATLIGDAAHAVTPHAGQGCNISIEDAEALEFLLSEATASEDIPPALETLARLRKARAQRIAFFSRQQGGLLSEEERKSRDPITMEEHSAATYGYQGAEEALKALLITSNA